MPALARSLSVLALCATLWGCPAFFVDQGDVVKPAASLTPPASLPASESYLDRQATWQREGRIGLGGYAVATLLDPSLASAQVAHEAAVQSLRTGEAQALLANRWNSLYGTQRDRFPIELAWRFDEQFISDATILEPDNWTFTLEDSQGQKFSPLSVQVLDSSRAPREGFWEGRLRLTFPWRDPGTGLLLLGGETRWVRLTLKHVTGTGSFTWRFRNTY